MNSKSYVRFFPTSSKSALEICAQLHKPSLKCSFKYVTYESVMDALTVVAWYALGTLVNFCFTW